MKGVSVIFLMALAFASQSYAASVALTWDYVDEPLNPAVSFTMYRNVGCTGNFDGVGIINKPAVEYTDTTVSPGVVYCYRVTANSNIGEESSASNTLQFQVPLPPIAKPFNLRIK